MPLSLCWALEQGCPSHGSEAGTFVAICFVDVTKFRKAMTVASLFDEVRRRGGRR